MTDRSPASIPQSQIVAQRIVDALMGMPAPATPSRVDGTIRTPPKPAPAPKSLPIGSRG